MVRGRCPCGAEHAACGPPSTSQPVLENLEVAAVGGPLKLYDVVMHGMPTRMKLNEDDAKRYNATPVDAPKVETQTETPDVPAQPTETEIPGKARTARNKRRTPANKDGGAGGGDD
jgi:hypothetical protein